MCIHHLIMSSASKEASKAENKFLKQLKKRFNKQYKKCEKSHEIQPTIDIFHYVLNM